MTFPNVPILLVMIFSIEIVLYKNVSNDVYLLNITGEVAPEIFVLCCQFIFSIIVYVMTDVKTN